MDLFNKLKIFGRTYSTIIKFDETLWRGNSGHVVIQLQNNALRLSKAKIDLLYEK